MVFAGIIVASVGALSYTNGRTALRESAAVNVASIALEKEAALELWWEERLEDIATMAGSPSLVEIAQDHIAALPAIPENHADHAALLEQFRYSGNNHFTDLLLIEAEFGMVINSTDAGDLGKFKENRPYFIEGKKGKYFQNPYYSFQSQSLAVTFSAPIRSEAGTVLGVLVGRANLSEINDIVTRSSGNYQSEDVFIVDSSGLVLTQPRFLSDDLAPQRGIHTEVVEECLSKTSGSLAAIDYRGIPTLAAYRWLAESGFCLVVKVDQAEAYGPVNAFRNDLAVLGLLILIPAALLGLLLATSINRPILALKKGVLAFRSGELTVRLPDTSHDELGDLARAFNEMATERGRVEQQLQNHRQQLERLVQDRTAKLQEEVVARASVEE